MNWSRIIEMIATPLIIVAATFVGAFVGHNA